MGERFTTKEGVRDAIEELASSRELRNAPAQMVTLLSKLADWVRQHRWAAAQWLDGDLVIEVTPLATGTGCLVSLSSNLGFGLCAPVFYPVVCEDVSFEEVEWIAENVPELASPLHVYRGRERVRLELARDDDEVYFVPEATPSTKRVPPPPDTVRSPLDPDATLSVPALTQLLVAEMSAISERDLSAAE
jgi:hypothetical protein